MRVADLGGLRVAIWGRGREGRAAIDFLQRFHPGLPLLLLDDKPDEQPRDGAEPGIEFALGAERIASAIDNIDVIIKSPGVSLYRPEIRYARENGAKVTSLMNLWFAEAPDITTICVTGTKGKSTTASLIAHTLTKLGRRVALAGNIGVPITAIDSAMVDIAVIEVSSYQAADFDGICDIAVLTSLYPEHIDWHLSVENYYRDKFNLLSHSRCRVLNREAAQQAEQLVSAWAQMQLFNNQNGIHSSGTMVFDAAEAIGPIPNPYLARPHNGSNLCAALTTAKSLGIDPAAALDATCGFCGLPHRQQELGEIGGVLFVDDSISTIPESAIAALEVYGGRDITIIVGGYDRGLDYRKLVDIVVQGAAKAMICLGDSGERIYALAQDVASRSANPACAIRRSQSMEDAVSFAREVTPRGGVVLLSPAAPSYGYYRDFIERGRDFAAKAGLPAS